MLKSALTEQLSSGTKQAEKTFAPLGLLQNPAFPCLRHAEGEVEGAGDAVSEANTGLPEVDVPDIDSMQLAGTLPPMGSVPKDRVAFLQYVLAFSCVLVDYAAQYTCVWAALHRGLRSPHSGRHQTTGKSVIQQLLLLILATSSLEM
jgi:hypothetical protein